MLTIRSGRHAWAIAFVALLAPGAAHAQLGGLIKRAIGEKVVDKVPEKVTKPEGQKTDSAAGTIVPGGRAGRLRMSTAAPMASILLTADTLDQALRGLDVMARSFSRRDSIGALGDAAGRRVGELSSTNAELSRTFHEKASAIHNCRQEVFSAIAKKRGEDLQAKMAADPGLQRRFAESYMKYMSAARDAAARGDSATLQKLQLDYYRAVMGAGFSSRQDTVSATSKCGADMRMPSVLALEDSLRRESSRLAELRREVENGARTDAIAASGLPAERFDAARERIELWYRGRKTGRTAALTAPEEQALGAQLPRIERIMRALGVQG